MPNINSMTFGDNSWKYRFLRMNSLTSITRRAFIWNIRFQAIGIGGPKGPPQLESWTGSGWGGGSAIGRRDTHGNAVGWVFFCV